MYINKFELNNAMGRNPLLITLCGSLVCLPLAWKYTSYGTVLKQRKKTFMNVLAEETDKKPKVLIVGAGLTGCITSYLLRKAYGDAIDVKIFERSPYPSGRFGAGLRYKKNEKNSLQSWCDMGSQVLSVLNCEGGHPNACTSGHGMHSEGKQNKFDYQMFKVVTEYGCR